jgi:hypothetical protein
MKKLIIILLLLMTTIVYAKTTILDTKIIVINGWNDIYIKVLCIDGYKYILTDKFREENSPPQLTQMFKQCGGYPVPIECKN